MKEKKVMNPISIHPIQLGVITVGLSNNLSREHRGSGPRKQKSNAWGGS